MKVRLDPLLFYSAYLLCLVDGLVFGYSTMADLPYARLFSMALRLCAAVLVLTKLILDRKYSLKLLLTLVAVGAGTLLSFVRSGYSHVFYLMILCLGLRGVDVERAIRLDFWARMLVCLFIVLCAAIGLTENYITHRTGSQVIRYSMGFNHPNTMASLVLSLMLEDAWIHRRHAAGFYTLVIWTVAGITYLISANRTAVALMVLLPGILLLTGSRPLNPEGRGRKICVALFPGAAILSWLAMILCRSSGLLRGLDALLSNRFYNAGVLYKAYGASMLGQKITLVSVKTARLTNSSIALLDVAYLRLAIQAGVVILGLLAVLYGRAFRRAWDRGSRLQVVILAIFVLFGMFESGFNNVFLNFTLLLAAQTLFPEAEGR